MNNKKSNWKANVEQNFGQLSLFISRHPWSCLLLCLVIVAGMASQLVHLKQDTSLEGYLKSGDPDIAIYNEFKDVFGKDEVFIITVAVDDFFNQDFIDKFRNLHEDLEQQVPYLQRVDSLINARYTYGDDDTMYIEDLLPETLPEDPQAYDKLKSYIYNSDTYKNWLISEDRSMLVITVRLSAFIFEENANGDLEQKYIEDAHLEEAMATIEQLIEKHRGMLSDDIRLAGSIPMAVKLSAVTKRDFIVFTALAIVLIGAVLFIIFRRWSGVFMPLTVMLFGVIITISLMAIQGSPMQVATSLLPSFLLAVCVGDSIHLLTIFYRQYDTGVSKELALSHAMEHTGLAIFFTSITTAAGLASFSFSDLAPVSSLGYYGAVGSIVAFVLTITILPTLISLIPLKRRAFKEDKDTILQPILHWFSQVSVKHAKPIVVISVLLFATSSYFVSQLNFSHLPINWLPQQDELRLASENYDAKIGGSLALEIVIDTGKERGVNNVAFMQKLNEVQAHLSQWKEPTFDVKKVIAVTDIIKESHRALNGNRPEFYTIPDNAELISQELFLVELDRPDDLFQMIDNPYRRARMTVLIPMIDTIHIIPVIAGVKAYLTQTMAPLDVNITYTGVTPILGSTFAKMLYSTAESYVLAGIAITVMMVLLIGSLKLGLISMFPSLLPIVMVLAVVQLAGIDLDILTMLVGSIAIGLTVDDNVHFMHGFKRVYQQTGDPAYAIEQTLQSTGRAMLITSIVLSIGFFIYTQSMTNNMTTFGFVTGMCIILALVATFLLSPALMVLVNKTWHPQENVNTQESTKQTKDKKETLL
ncbi:MAG: MMPL family transporter [Pseudomonadales bacterium]|nr:MMPL family transporter [Pseudomonadales bacterium]